MEDKADFELLLSDPMFLEWLDGDGEDAPEADREPIHGEE